MYTLLSNAIRYPQDMIPPYPDCAYYELRALYSVWQFDRYNRLLGMWKRPLFLAVVPRYSPNPLPISDSKSLLYTNYIDQTSGCGIIECKPRNNGRHLIMAPSPFSPKKARDWLRHCTKKHTSSCHTRKRPIHGHYLVDCQNLTVVAADQSHKYVALSYVWGSSNRSLLRRNETSVHLPEHLSLVVEDAITVTQSLGYRYLWIDKFCIDQRNPKVKHAQIQQMDAIYGGSELTIIAAAGQDEDYGLPGVSLRQRTAPLPADIGEFQVSWFKDPHGSIRRSKWNTSGWTYQETLLSCRRLVFLDDQAYFECMTTNACDMIP